MLHNPDKKVDVVAEESKQINESGTQISFQAKIEEVKQVSGKREQATSPQRNIFMTGKLVFKAKQAHLHNYLNLW